MLKDNFNFLDNKTIHRCAVENNFKNRFDAYIAQMFKEKTKDGNITPTKQGNTGNCWILSAINSFSYSKKGRELISRALEYKKGYTIVHTVCGDYVVLDSEVNLTKISKQYSLGDDDMIIFELALEKIIDDCANKRIKIDKNTNYLIKKTLKTSPTIDFKSSTAFGYPGACYYFLTGIEPGVSTTQAKMLQHLNMLKERNGEDIALCATSHSKFHERIRDTKHKIVQLYSCHAYAIKMFDGENVTVVNPHDSSVEIILTKHMFFKMFANIQICDFSSKVKKEYFKPKMFYSKTGKLEKTIEIDENNYQIQYSYKYNNNLKPTIAECIAQNPNGMYVVCISNLVENQKYIINGNANTQLALARIYNGNKLVEMRFGAGFKLDSDVNLLNVIPIKIGKQIHKYALYQYNNLDFDCVVQIAKDLLNGDFERAFELCR